MAENSILNPSYPIELLSQRPFLLDPKALKRALGQRLGAVDSPDDADPGKALLFFLRDFPVTLDDATVPAQIAFLQTDKTTDSAEYKDALGQSWDVDDAAERLAACRHSVAMVNMASSTLPQAMRRKIIAGGLLSLLEQADADLIHWSPTQQLVDPSKAFACLNAPEQRPDPTYGFVNVRFFAIEGSGGDTVMDTLGLGALGLTDLQIHFRDLEPARVASLLHDTAAYLIKNGNVIDNGHTVRGLKPEDRWLCMHEMALMPPERVVLDIDPGKPFAAGPD